VVDGGGMLVIINSLLAFEWDIDFDLGSDSDSGMHAQHAAHHACPFLHGGQSQAKFIFPLHTIAFNFEPNPVIYDLNIDGCAFSLDFNRNILGVGVFLDIVQGFLNDAIDVSLILYLE
jgi:hypothetical protein